MVRLTRYKCPKSEFEVCEYDWNDDEDGEVCIKCNMTMKDADTIWIKILFKYYRIVPYEKRPHQLWYKFKCWAWKRYTTVKPRKLGHTWCDRSHLLPHVMFEVLCDFVEKEMYPAKKEGIVDWFHREEDREIHDEILDLYRWWTKEYDDDYPWNLEPTPDNALELEDKNRELLEANCKRLIDVSKYMWT